MEQKRSKFIGSLIGTAIGDSLGARFEGAPVIRDVNDIGPRYTDDTAMMIGVAESLIDRKGFDYWHMAERFVQNYEREPWRRYGSGPPRIFRMMQNGRMGFGMLDRDLYPGGSFGNGGAMRVGPVGLLYYDDPRSIREIAYHTAGITHSNELALEGAAIQACAVALAVLADPVDIKSKEFLGALRMFTKPGPYQEKLKLIIKLLDENPSIKEIVNVLGNGIEALRSVPTAIYSFLSTPDFESAVLYAVSLGGDTDTIGAMTGAISGACYGVEGIPAQWRGKVENRQYIEDLAINLWEVKENTNVAR
ncbi:MAG: ADP-ribosylglycohydrolase family protein [Nitrospiraceae bacterium]|nr:ADP-ribosylglycohydrolase family protein [Nitrospiraceae bacterium]